MFTYKIKLDTRLKEKTKKGFPVIVYLRLNGKSKTFGLKMYFELSDWDLDNEIPRNNKNALMKIIKYNQDLENFDYRIFNGEIFTLDDIKNSLLGIIKKSPDNDFLSFFDLIINEKRAAILNNNYMLLLNPLYKRIINP